MGGGVARAEARHAERLRSWGFPSFQNAPKDAFRRGNISACAGRVKRVGARTAIRARIQSERRSETEVAVVGSETEVAVAGSETEVAAVGSAAALSASPAMNPNSSHTCRMSSSEH